MSRPSLLATPAEISAQFDADRPLEVRLAALEHLVARMQVPLMSYLRQQITESDARLDLYQDIWRDATAAIWDIVRRFARAFQSVCPNDPRDDSDPKEHTHGHLTRLPA